MKSVGKFYMTESFMRSGSAQEIFGVMAFVPFRVEYLYERMAFECIGICHLFDPLDDGFVAPEYKIEITEHEDPKIDEIIVKAIKV